MKIVEEESLIRTLTHVLRHKPWLYELEPDSEGWVSLTELLSALRMVKKEWAALEEKDLITIIVCSRKRWLEVKKGKIRAISRRPSAGKLLKVCAVPPEFLYHGTTPNCFHVIAKEGLKPMNRQYVHLSSDVKTAVQVSRQKSVRTLVLPIYAKKAHLEGIKFYVGNDHVWLADSISPQYIFIR